MRSHEVNFRQSVYCLAGAQFSCFDLIRFDSVFWNGQTLSNHLATTFWHRRGIPKFTACWWSL